MKIKMRKLLTFSLLLCTIFSTLFALTPNVRAVATTTPPTDLTGYTVTVPAGWNAPSGYGMFNILGSVYSVATGEKEFDFWKTTQYNFFIGYRDINTPVLDSIYYLRSSSAGVILPNGTYRRIYNITGGTDVTNQSLIQWFVDNNATFDNGEEEPPVPINPSVTVNQDSSSSVNITSSSDIYYMINNSNYWVPFITNESSFPYTIDDVSSIQFKNDNLQYDLIIYNWTQELLTLSPGTSSRVFEVTEPLDLSLALVSSTDPLYHIEGYYTFNSVLDIPTDNLSQFEFSSVGSGIPYQYMIYNSSTGVLSYIEVTESGNTYTSSAFSKIENGTKLYLIDSQYQYIFIESSNVNEYTYNYLTSNGIFGEYNPPPETDSTFVSDFLLGSLDNFLSFELYPGFSLLNLLSLIVAIPLLIYILKLFLGG